MFNGDILYFISSFIMSSQKKKQKYINYLSRFPHFQLVKKGVFCLDQKSLFCRVD